VELILSIAIFSIIALYIYQAINTAKNSNDIHLKRLSEDKREQKITTLFYNDLFSQTNIYAAANITNEAEFDVFYLRARNSIHAMINPYIAYFVKDNALFRIESKAFEKIPLTYESVERVKVDKLLSNVTLFRIYENKNSYLISYKNEDKLTSFQISLPQRPAPNTSNGSQNGSRNRRN
jgi:hypothetical protein